MLSTDHIKVLIAASREGLGAIANKVPSQALLNISISITEAEKYVEEESKPKDAKPEHG